MALRFRVLVSEKWVKSGQRHSLKGYRDQIVRQGKS